jgi:hypothetical protein
MATMDIIQHLGGDARELSRRWAAALRKEQVTRGVQDHSERPER